jgi:signal transduction histidine kinase
MHLDVAMEQAPVAIAVFGGPGFAVEFANHTYRRWFNQDVPGPQDRLAAVLRSGRAFVEPELLVRDAERRKDTYWTVTHVPLRSSDGTIAGVMIVGHEVTDLVLERKRAELAGLQLEGELREATEIGRLLRTFTGMVAHDLRNPLAAIRYAVEAALAHLSGPDEEVRPILRRILHAGKRMHRMIEQLVDFTRVGVGSGLLLTPEPANLRDLADQAVAELEDRYPSRVTVECVGELSGIWDIDRLIEMLSNLTSNALEHGRRDTPVRLRLDGTDREAVELRVNNQGAISPSQLPTLFDPFRGETARRGRTEGLGLGLFITREIVAAHDGDIRFESSEDTGTLFIVRLPRRPQRLVHTKPHVRPAPFRLET